MVSAYNDGVKQFKEQAENIIDDNLNWFNVVFNGFGFSNLIYINKPPYPGTPPLDYAGIDPVETEKDFGYGTLSAGTFAIKDKRYQKVFGMAGL